MKSTRAITLSSALLVAACGESAAVGRVWRNMDGAGSGTAGLTSPGDVGFAPFGPHFPWRVAFASVLTITVGMLPGLTDFV